MANVRNGSSGNRAAHRAKSGKLSTLPVSARTSTAAAHTLVSCLAANQFCQYSACFIGWKRTSNFACKQTDIRVGVTQQAQAEGVQPPAGMARSASSAAVRWAASSERR